MHENMNIDKTKQQIYMYVGKCTCMYIYIYMYMYIYTCICTPTSIHTCTYVPMPLAPMFSFGEELPYRFRVDGFFERLSQASCRATSASGSAEVVPRSSGFQKSGALI